MEYPPCSIGNTSSIRVHFPASYVSLRECFFCVSTRPRLAMRFWNTCKIFSRDPKRACESCHWKKKLTNIENFVQETYLKPNEMSINIPKVQLKRILLDFGYIHRHFIWFHLDIRISPQKSIISPRDSSQYWKFPKGRHHHAETKSEWNSSHHLYDVVFSSCLITITKRKIHHAASYGFHFLTCVILSLYLLTLV